MAIQKKSISFFLAFQAKLAQKTAIEKESRARSHPGQHKSTHFIHPTTPTHLHNTMQKLSLVLLLLTIFACTCNALHAWAWVGQTGTISNQGGDFKINVTHIATGHYCLTYPEGTYCAIQATLQGSPPTPGVTGANSGWGDDCNPYGGDAVYIYNLQGQAMDSYFSVSISC